MELQKRLESARKPISKSFEWNDLLLGGYALPKLWLGESNICVEVNSSAEEFLQLPKDLLIGLSLEALFFELQIDGRSIGNYTSQKEPIECLLKTGQGESKQVRVYIERVSRQKVTLIEMSFLDLTHAKKDLNKVIEAESKYRTFANAIPQLAWMADETGAIFWHSERFFEFTGASTESISGFSWMEMIAPEHRDRFVEVAQSHIASGDVAEAILKVKSAERGFQWCLVRSIPIKNQKGQVLRWFGNATPLPDILTSHLPADGYVPDQPSAFSS